MKLITGLLRILLGGLFVGHGTQKLFGWFGGNGLDATSRSFESMGLRPGGRAAALAGASEAGGGALFALGLGTPLAGSAIAGTMVQAIRSVHGDKGPWVTQGGWEYNAVVIAAVAAIVEAGGGAMSLDRRLGLDFGGPVLAAATVAAAAVGPPLLLKPAKPEPAAYRAPAPPRAQDDDVSADGRTHVSVA